MILSGGAIMAVCYDNLWKLLIDKKLKRTDLKDICAISSNVLAKLGKNEPISMDSLEKICASLNCRVEDVITFVDSHDETTEK